MPIVIALGLIMILVGTATIFRSHEDRVNASSQRSSERALNAAKTGLTFYQELINNNRIIAIYPDCVGTRNSSGVCPDSGSTESWANHVASGISSVCNSTNVTNGATTGWQNISGDPNLGQYRLRSYTYPTPGIAGNTATIGTLTVEGRFNQSSGDDTAAAIAVEVDIPVQTESPTLDSLAPGLWIGNDSGTNLETENDFTNLTVNGGKIVLSDSACDTSTISGEAVIPDPRSLPDTADLPPVGTINTITNSELILASQLPRGGDTGDSDNFYHYVVEGDLNLDGEDLNIVLGTKVILYVQGDITFNGDVNINQANDSAFLEIYGNTNDGSTDKYGCPTAGVCSTDNVNFTGSGTINVNAFIHAPAARANLTDSPTVDVTGAMWVDKLDASSGTITITPDGQYSNYTSKGNMPDKPTISSPTELEIIEVE